VDLRELETLGEPDLQIAGLQIWVHGRQFAEAMDYWDGNWLRVTAYAVYADSAVRVRGSIVHLGEVDGLMRGCERLYASLNGVAKLACIEPNLSVTMEIQKHGHMAVQVEITPDHLSETHTFRSEFDQSYLPEIIRQCNALLARLPIRNADGAGPKHAA
jgi:hypothetical protein